MEARSSRAQAGEAAGTSTALNLAVYAAVHDIG
jgi:hypothetical protein